MEKHYLINELGEQLKKKNNVINELLSRIARLEYELEEKERKLEECKNEKYNSKEN